MSEPRLVPLPASTGQASVWVLGLEWQPVINESGSASQARRIAAHVKASHYVYAPGSHAVGHGRLTLKVDGKRCAGHSAAQTFASDAGPGVSIAWLRLDGESDSIWLSAAHDGSVVRGTDAIYSSAEEARSALLALTERYQDVAIHTNDLGLESPDPAATVYPYDWDRLTAVVPSAQLRAAHVTWATLPAPLRVAVVGVMAYAMWQFASTQWAEWQAEQAASEALAVAAPAVDARLEWSQAIARTLAATRVDSSDAIAALLTGIRGLPHRIDGWQLTQIDCMPAAEGWACNAHYSLSRPGAASANLLPHVRPEWRVTALSLTEARIAVSVPATPARRSDATLGRFNDLLDTLQRSRSAFTRIKLGEPRALPIQAPTAEGGAMLPRPGDLRIPQSREIELDGPLRSLAYSLPDLAAAGLQLHAIAVRIAPNELPPRLAVSRITATLKGDIHAQ